MTIYGKKNNFVVSFGWLINWKTVDTFTFWYKLSHKMKLQPLEFTFYNSLYKHPIVSSPHRNDDVSLYVNREKTNSNIFKLWHNITKNKCHMQIYNIIKITTASTGTLTRSSPKENQFWNFADNFDKPKFNIKPTKVHTKITLPFWHDMFICVCE